MLETKKYFEAVLSVFLIFDPLARTNIKIEIGHEKEGWMLIKSHPGFTWYVLLLKAQKAILEL